VSKEPWIIFRILESRFCLIMLHRLFHDRLEALEAAILGPQKLDPTNYNKSKVPLLIDCGGSIPVSKEPWIIFRILESRFCLICLIAPTLSRPS
jgi:hypothetical protein